MSAATVPAEATAERDARPPREGRVPHAGWRVIAAKELGDHLLSVRFIVLLIVLGLAAAIPLYFAADLIRAAAPQASGVAGDLPARCSRIGSQDYTFLRVDSFVAIVAPLLGLAFAFDAINGERSEGTLPRLLAQPIYRDDVINGKFVAGLAVIGVVLLAVIGIIAGLRHLPARDRARVGGGRPARGLDRRDVRVRRAVAGVRAAAVRRSSGGRPRRR